MAYNAASRASNRSHWSQAMPGLHKLKELQRTTSIPIFSSTLSAETMATAKRDSIAYFRRRINEAIENSDENIDLSCILLSHVPKEIEELRYMTSIAHRSISVPSIKLFLHGNLLTSLPCELYSIKNITVLSLRNNQLAELSPAISHLASLKELHIGGNQLRFLPAEIKSLPLALFSARPNPFFTADDIEPLNAAPLTIRPALFEQLIQELLASYGQFSSSEYKLPSLSIPYAISSRLPTSIKALLSDCLYGHLCSACLRPFLSPHAHLFAMERILTERQLPVRSRLCGPGCLKDMLETLQRPDFLAADASAVEY